MVPRHSIRVAVVVGGACLGLGVALGSAWPPAGSGRRPAADPPRSTAALPSFAEVVERIQPGVVTVRGLRAERSAEPLAAAAGQRPDGLHAAGPGVRTGSGFVVDARGLVVTSRHVVAQADTIVTVLPGGAALRGELVGEDRATDLALLRLVSPPGDLVALPLAADDDLRVGDWIVAVGSPLGYTHSVTAGIVSFVGRHLMSDYGVTNDFLQISAPVNPGNSGCPVVDLRGRVVGVTTQAPADAQGISFAVPSRTLRWTLDAMQRRPDGRVRRGYLGIEFTSCAPERGQPQAGRGAVIVHVVKDAPADHAGVQAGDVVTSVEGVPVPDARALHARIACAEPGTSLSLRVRRGAAAEQALVAVLGEVGAVRPGAPN